MLEINDLHVSYGPIAALRGLTMSVKEGQVVGLIGPNGAGKSTLMSTVAGVLKPLSGSVRFDGASLAGVSPEKIVGCGISVVPEARDIFGSLSVRENLRLGATVRRGARDVAADIDRMLAIFPPLEKYFTSRASGLSGGEQQMLAIARALMARPRLLLLDEPSLGLAPVIVDAVFSVLRTLRDDGVTMLLVEQNAARTLDISDYVYVMRSGTVQTEGTPDRLHADGRFEAIYLGGQS